MPIDWEDKVGGPTIAVFGEAATYTPADGSGAYPVTGVYDEQFRPSAVIDTSVTTTDTLPVFGVNARQFRATPQQSDRLSITRLAPRAFLVKEPRPDGHGVFHLVLNETDPDA